MNPSETVNSVAGKGNVVVIGSDHHNTLGVVESLGMAGLSPYVVIVSGHTLPRSFVLKSKYCRGKGIITTYDELIGLLHKTFGGNGTERYVAITTNDRTASLLDNHYDELSPFLLLPGTGNQGDLEHWMDKPNMIEVARSVGMNVPQTRIVKAGETVDDFVFPCITKSISTLKGGKSNIRICNDKQSLNGFLSKQTQYDEVQVQQFIDKDFEFQFIGCSMGGGEEIIIPGRTHIVRPNGYDNTFFLRYLAIDDTFITVLSQVKAFIRQTRYSGPFSIEFIRDHTGTDYFLEMNFRNDGNAVCVTASGTNLPLLWYLYHQDIDAYRAELEKSTFKPVALTPLVHYFYNMAQGEVPFGEWLRNNRHTTQFSTYFKHDQAPFWCHLGIERKQIIRALAHKLFRRSKH